MDKEKLENILIYEVIPDILYCMNENSKYNQNGNYIFECNEKKLSITFNWEYPSARIKPDGSDKGNHCHNA